MKHSIGYLGHFDRHFQFANESIDRSAEPCVGHEIARNRVSAEVGSDRTRACLAFAAERERRIFGIPAA